MRNAGQIKRVVRHGLISVLFAFASFSAAAQQLTVTVDSVGQLGTQLSENIRYSMTDLKICGPLNASDLKFIQQLTNRVKAKKSNSQTLTSLDLSEAEITESKGVVLNGRETRR